MRKSLLALKRILPIIIIGLTAYFFARALSENWYNLDGISLVPSINSVVGVLLLILSVILSGYYWGKLLEALSNKSVNQKDAVRIHCASWLLKYIPGQAGSVLNKLAWGNKNGFSKKVITNSFIYENVLMVFAGVILSIPVIFIFEDKLGTNLSILLPLLIIVPMLLVIYRPIFYGLLNFIFAKLKRKLFSKEDFLNTPDLFKFLISYILPRIVNGAGFVFVVASIINTTPDMYLGLGSAYILAGIVGVLAIFVPSGLGVREAVIVLLLSQYFGTEQAIVISLVARFYATIADIGVFGVYLLLNKGKFRQL